MISVTELAFTGYPITDATRARGFYEGVLNLKPTINFEHEGKHWIEYDVGPGTLAITNMYPKWNPSPDGPALALELADFDHAIAQARAAGVTLLTEPMVCSSCRLALIADPDGNTLILHKREHP